MRYINFIYFIAIFTIFSCEDNNDLVLENCTSDYSTSNILTNIDEEIFNNDESVQSLSIFSWTENDDNRILVGNGIPNHEVGTFPNSGNPNTISAQDINETFTLCPEVVSNNGVNVNGPAQIIAYAINSVKFDPGTAGRCNDDGVCRLAQGQGNWNIEALGHNTFDFGDEGINFYVPGSGILFEEGIYLDLTTTPSVTITFT